jgi:chromosome segregation ATPase
LGGQPPLLGRADDARTFIKNDEEVGEIEIELAPFPNKPRHTIRRIIDRNKGSQNGRGIAASTYYINKEQVNVKAVQKLVSETYLTAIDNLCTFLPQDLVGSFSGFNSKMLLAETEKSISGTQHLYTTHQELISLEEELLASDGNLQTIQDKADTLQNEVDQLEREKEMMEERTKHLEKLQLFKQRHAWIRFDKKREDATRMKEEKQHLKGKLIEARKSVQPIAEEIDGVTVELERNTQRKNGLKRIQGSATKAWQGQLSKLDKYQDEIENDKVNLSEIDSNHRRAIRRVEDSKNRLEDSEKILQQFPPEKELVSLYKEAHEESRAIRGQLKGAKHELQQLQR